MRSRGCTSWRSWASRSCECETVVAPLSGAAAATSAAAPAAACSAVPAAAGAPRVPSESAPAHPPAPLLPPCGRPPCRLPPASCHASPATASASAQSGRGARQPGVHITQAVGGWLAGAAAVGGSGGGAPHKAPRHSQTSPRPLRSGPLLWCAAAACSWTGKPAGRGGGSCAQRDGSMAGR